MKLSIIAACDLNNAIGKDNTLPWRLPADLANFKALTTGKIVIMGRKTWDSLGRKPLPNRKCIVISSNPRDVLIADIPDDNGVIAVPSLHEARKAAEVLIENGDYPLEVFVIGGGQIYHAFMSIADAIYLSRVNLKVEGADAFFPEIDRDVFRQDLSLRHTQDKEKNTHEWYYQIWNRISGGELSGRVQLDNVTNVKMEIAE